MIRETCVDQTLQHFEIGSHTNPIPAGHYDLDKNLPTMPVQAGAGPLVFPKPVGSIKVTPDQEPDRRR